MAWKMTVTETGGTEQRGDPPIAFDITTEGRWTASVDYFDDEDARTILHRKRFDFGAGITPKQALERMKTEGKRVRDAKAALAASRSGSGRLLGQTFPID